LFCGISKSSTAASQTRVTRRFTGRLAVDVNSKRRASSRDRRDGA
jgi:hypothetical protein